MGIHSMAVGLVQRREATMFESSRRLGRRPVWFWAGMCILALTGCRKERPTFEVVSLEGKIESIDAYPDGTGEISVLYYSEKRGKDMIGVGAITPSTEILINGAVAKAVDLRQGDRVRGQVRVDKKSKGRQQIVLKIYVDRAVPTGG